jgi:hypothetical protein
MDMYVPFFTILEFIFYFGWLKVSLLFGARTYSWCPSSLVYSSLCFMHDFLLLRFSFFSTLRLPIFKPEFSYKTRGYPNSSLHSFLPHGFIFFYFRFFTKFTLHWSISFFYISSYSVFLHSSVFPCTAF